MSLDIIVGAQWGDEGKGRVVDLLAAEAEYVARYNGGDNAGHTVTVGEQTFKLHLIPSGVVHPHTIGVIGNGVVVNPRVLLEEIESLRAAGVEITPKRLRISHAAHVITPAHLALDKALEQARGDEKIGTTLRGIGPAYHHKAARTGLRMEAMLSLEDFAEAVADQIEGVNEVLINLYHAQPLGSLEIAKEYVGYARKIIPYIGNVSYLLNEALRNEAAVLAEGAQGTLLDLDHGTYPFVTSSNPTAAGALVGLGLSASHVGRVIGVTKAFQTRVGEGPFPTEAFGAIAGHLRGTGEKPWDEFGVTTGRPRRVGWLDGVLLRYAVQINGLTELTITKLDVLSGLDTLHICVGYQADGITHCDLPLGPTNLAYKPQYENLPGWEDNIMDRRRWEELPQAAQAYIQRIEEIAEAPVRCISVGPERGQVIKLVVH